MKYYATITAIALLAFALGWFMRGDIIYGDMFNYTMGKSVSTGNDLLQGLKK